MMNLGRAVWAFVFLVACGSEAKSPPPPPPPPPPPLPSAPSAPPAPSVALPGEPSVPTTDSTAPARAPSDAAKREKSRGSNQGADETQGKSPPPTAQSAAESAKTSPEKTTPEKTATDTPNTAAPAKTTKPAKSADPAKPATKVVIPSTDHVRVTVPKGLQADLDKDPRMQPFVNQVIAVADKCYATERKKNPAAKGVIEARITMHEDERPSVNMKDPPPQLTGVVACASMKLMRVKMPLFTGKEGQKHTVKIRFDK